MDTINLLMPIIIGLIITPIVQIAKKVAFLSAIDPRYITSAVSILAVFLLTRLYAPDMTWADIIKTALALVGGATLGHAGLQEIKKTGGSK
jgi:hypothetical protein